MSVPTSLSRQFALRLVKHARSMLPASASRWGAAMQHELEYIQADRAALQWAVGCVSSSYARRLASLDVLKMPLLRWPVAVLMISWTSNSFEHARLFCLKVAGWPVLPGPGMDYQKFISAVNAIPTWAFMLGGVTGVFYIAAAYCLIRKKVTAVAVLMVGTVLGVVGFAAKVIAILGEHRWVLSLGSLQRESIVFALQFCIVLLLWQSFTRSGRPGAGHRGG